MKRVGLVLSAIAFFCLQIHQSSDAVAAAVTAPFLIVFALKMPKLAGPRPISKAAKAVGALTAMGVCLWPIDGFAAWLRSITVFQRFQGFLGVETTLLSQIAAIVFAVAGLLFVYQMVCLFYEKLYAAVHFMMDDFTKEEGMVALAAAVLLTAAVVMVYQQTDAFASPTVTRDLIYTSDSGAIVHENAYLSMNALENDFRSPLFALFAAPLMGLPYLLGRILPVPNAVATVLVAAQAPILAASFCLLMKMIKIESKPARILLPMLMLTTYSALLFVVMAEQYVIALFYLSLTLYALAVRKRRESILVLGAAGAMIPGAALAFVPENREKTWTAVLADALKTALWGLILLCTFGGFGMLLRIPETMRSVSRFTGAGMALLDRLSQYVSFVGQIFAAPQAGGITAADGYMKWRLAETGGVSALGIVLLALAIAGFILNRKQGFARIAAGWAALSVLLLGVLGWGTAENGLTLYTLYFGWAYAALIVYLIESLMKAVKLTRYTWAVYALGGAAMLWYNLPHLRELVLFATTNYPLV